jgi:hypothetical protein
MTASECDLPLRTNGTQPYRFRRDRIRSGLQAVAFVRQAFENA